MNSLNLEKLETAVNYIESWLDVNFRNSKFPGMQVAVMHDDKVVYSKAFGYSDLKTRKKLNTDNIFRIASISKTITATVIMQLVEAGKLDLDDKASKYLNWFKSNKDDRVVNITIRQLMCHTSGMIRDGIDADYWHLQREFPDEKELREYLSTCELIFDGDERFKYSNYGYGYLGLIIKAVSGVSYRDYVTKNIINKLNLSSTWPDWEEKASDLLAKGYGIEIFGRERKQYDAKVDTHALSPAAGFCSNAENLCTFFAAHFFGNNKLLNDYSKRLMQRRYWETQFGYYGFGLDVIKKKGWKIYGHGGGIPGFRTNAQFDPIRRLAVSVLVNSDSVNPKGICSSLINIVDIFQQNTDDIKQDVNIVLNFEGRFYSAEYEPKDIVAVGKKLFAIDPLGWSEFDKAEELVVLDETTLKIEKAGGFSAPGEKITYKFDDSGDVTSIIAAGRTMLPYTQAKKRGWVE